MDKLIAVLKNIDQRLAEIRDVLTPPEENTIPVPGPTQPATEEPRESQFDIQKYIDRFR